MINSSKSFGKEAVSSFFTSETSIGFLEDSEFGVTKILCTFLSEGIGFSVYSLILLAKSIHSSEVVQVSLIPVLSFGFKVFSTSGTNLGSLVPISITFT